MALLDSQTSYEMSISLSLIEDQTHQGHPFPSLTSDHVEVPCCNEIWFLINSSVSLLTKVRNLTLNFFFCEIFSLLTRFQQMSSRIGFIKGQLICFYIWKRLTIEFFFLQLEPILKNILRIISTFSTFLMLGIDLAYNTHIILKWFNFIKRNQIAIPFPIMVPILISPASSCHF